MCVLVDANCISKVFDKSNKCYGDFEPVHKWIINGGGKMVYGGTKYLSEIRKMPKYLNLVKELRTSGKALTVSKDEVDRIWNLIKEEGSQYDDYHLVAIVRVSGVNVVCSNDEGAHECVKDKRLYNSPSDRPSIYQNATHKHLISKENITGCCR